MQIEHILSIASGALTIITIILSIILSCTKNKKTVKNCQTALDLVQEVKYFIVEAERKKNYTGDEKKDYVTMQTVLWCIRNNKEIPTEEQLSNLIDENVEFTNWVNVDKKNKEVK